MANFKVSISSVKARCKHPLTTDFHFFSTFTVTVIEDIITTDVEHTVMHFVIQTSKADHYAIMRKISKVRTSFNKTPSPL